MVTEWHQITEADVDRLGPAIESAVESLTDYGRGPRPDPHRLLDEVESSEDGLDLGTDLGAPAVRAILARGRAVYASLREAL